jgi:NAD+ kinase
MLLSSGDRADIVAEAARLRPDIQRFADVVLADFTGTRDVSTIDADVAIVIGGDGSILRAAHQMGFRQTPVLGVNMGKLGFLADLAPGELPAVLAEVAAGQYQVVDHLMLLCRVVRGPVERSDEAVRGAEAVRCERLALNEVAVLAGPPFAILDVELHVDSHWATTYSCDGLIVGTPVGSTAHSLSAGGPILRKDLQAVVICPISPHTLTNRPIVDSADRVYDLVVPQPHDGTSLVVDGQVLCTLSADDRVQIRRAAASFQLVEVPGHGYYRTLREKLGWGGGLPKRDL